MTKTATCKHFWIRYVLDASGPSHAQRDGADDRGRPYRDVRCGRWRRSRTLRRLDRTSRSASRRRPAVTAASKSSAHCRARRSLRQGTPAYVLGVSCVCGESLGHVVRARAIAPGDQAHGARWHVLHHLW
jgi:hypothetical protein